MKVYEKEMNHEGYICPYCKILIPCDEEWGYEFEGEIIECEDCAKKFIASASRNITFWSQPDCRLNNEKHVFKHVSSCSSRFCKKCGAIEPEETLNEIEEEDKNERIIKYLFS